MSINPPTVTESTILSSYLLNPSPLTTALPYSTFLSTCVPATYRTHPLIKRLYRDIQFQRNIDIDAVRQNIERECRRSPALKGRLAFQIANDSGRDEKPRKRKRQTESTNGIRPDDADDVIHSRDETSAVNMYEASAHPASQYPSSIRAATIPGSTHAMPSLLEGLKAAISALDQEVNEITMQNEQLQDKMKETVGQMSDLRYGRFARPSTGSRHETMEDEVVSALVELRSVLEEASKDAG